MVSLLTLGTPPSPLGNAEASVTITDYTYENIPGSITSGNTLADGVGSYNFTTSWGRIKLAQTAYTVEHVWYGTTMITGFFYDPYMEYWYTNLTVKTGRPFDTYWSTWDILYNDSYVFAAQKYAECPHFWSGSTNEFNLTLRLTILKDEPIIRVDQWLRNLNETSDIAKLNLGFTYYSGDAGISTTMYQEHHMALLEYPSKSYAMGIIGQRVYDGKRTTSCLYTWGWDELRWDTDKYFHQAGYILVGVDADQIWSLWERVGPTWNIENSPSHLNLVIARNDERIDVFQYYGSSYSYFTSEVTGTVYVNGAQTSTTATRTPILNYDKHALILGIDDLKPAYLFSGANESQLWVHNTTKEYDIRITYGSWLEGTTAEDNESLYAWYLAEDDGTRFEVGGHGWNHSGLYDPGGQPENASAEFAEHIFSLESNAWFNASGMYMTAFAHPWDAWGNDTHDGLGTGGVEVCRLGRYDWDSLDTRIRENMTALSFQRVTSYLFAGQYSAVADQSTSYGFYFMRGHDDDIWNPSTRPDAIAFYSWVENNTDIASVTMSQFGDLWHHRIDVSSSDGRYVIDMTDTIANQRVYLRADDEGDFPVFWDISEDRPVAHEYKYGQWYFEAQTGHQYQQVMRLEPVTSTRFSLSFLGANLNDPVLTWNVTGGPSVVYTVMYLNDDLGYRVYQDGGVVATGTGPSFPITATGGGEFVVAVWHSAEVSRMVVLTVNLVGIGIFVTLITGYVMPIANAIKKNRQLSTKILMDNLIKAVIFTVVGLVMWITLHEIAIG